MSTGRPKVFISYSSKDRAYADRLVDSLRQKGVHVWYDQTEIDVGQNIHDKVLEGLLEVDFLAIVLTPRSLESAWIREELSLAKQRELEEHNVIILPLLFEQVTLPLHLRSRKYANFTDFNTGFSEMMRAINRQAIVNPLKYSLLQRVRTFVVALLRRKPQEEPSPTTTTSIIKGLLPYTSSEEDVAWFAKLQRGSILRDCLRFCLGTSSSFAILSGESGTGKSSFLQAALCPSVEEQGQRAVYVKLTDKSPLESIRQSLDVAFGKSPEGQTLLSLLRNTASLDVRPILLILDQFEQFFSHHKTKASRKLFIKHMTEWYDSASSIPIKVLVSIRDDFADRMTEFQQEMEYPLTAHNKLRLEQFEPHEAAQVIGVIAKETNIKLDEAFVKELTRDELADREQGTVSPVDIQVLSWMLDGQKNSEERAFDRRAFQRLGGVEGLLERFLKRALEVRETETRRQAAIEVMLALTDQNVRAGALSLKQVKERLNKAIPIKQVEEAVSWLARSEVRLITEIRDETLTLYELAHERLIPALRRLALNEITEMERAQQTLDHRVNEWIGNNRARRYLLTVRELQLINRYKTLIAMGSQKEQKQQFVSLSKKNLLGRIVIATALLVLIVTGYGGYKRYESWKESWMVVAGSGMLPTMRDQESVNFERFNPESQLNVARGDVVVFRFPDDPSKTYIKRIIGLPEDEVEIYEGEVRVNGHKLEEPYVDPRFNQSKRSMAPIYVRPNYYFVLGDNRDSSSDSRIWGLVPERYILGRVNL